MRVLLALLLVAAVAADSIDDSETAGELEEEAELEAEVVALLNAGRKFEAIQLVRSYTDCTLHEAKEFIYALESGK